MSKLLSSKSKHVKVTKRTSQGGKKIKTSTLSKTQKRSYKKYKGQGR
jgi:hypothetical protein